MNTVSILQDVDTSYLDKLLLDSTGRMRLFPAATFASIPYDHLRVWAHKKARYQLVTKELVDWLREQIGGRSAIEVCAGMGDIGHYLGIPMSDSAVQNTPEVAAYYRSLGQVPTVPPSDVKRQHAEDAVAKHKPQVVIASWLTQKFKQGDTHGSVYGPDEVALMNACETYIHIGNENVHGDKRVRRFKHEVLRFPWLVSRASEPEKNEIYVWQK